MHRTVMLLAAAVTLLGGLASPATAAEAAPAPPSAARAASGSVALKVGSFNIKNVLFAKNPTQDWTQRRKVIIDQISREGLDVVGIQEAHNGHYLSVKFPDGPNQYLDLRNGLRKTGGDWQVTSAAAYNCKNAKTFHRCEKKDRGASRSTRILYDARKVELLKRGSIEYKKQIAEDRYLVWAIFRARATGKRFLFTTTHLTSRNEKTRLKQWKQMVREVDKLKGRKPAIVTGDMNVQKYHWIAQKMLPRMAAAGIPDVLNQQYRVNPTVPRAERLVNAWINSYNHGRKNVSKFSFAQQRDKIGNGIDWIFASRDLAVETWKVVVDYDPETLRVIGVLPSDHNLVTATVRMG